jgi:hypothetical protein
LSIQNLLGGEVEQRVGGGNVKQSISLAVRDVFCAARKQRSAIGSKDRP